MTKVVLPRPGDGVSPALLGRLSDHLVVNFEGEILLRLQGLESLEERLGHTRGRWQGVTHDSHWLELGYDGVREDADLGQRCKDGVDKWERELPCAPSCS